MEAVQRSFNTDLLLFMMGNLVRHTNIQWGLQITLMEQLNEVHIRSVEDAGIISTESLICLMPEVSFINIVQLTSLSCFLSPFPLRCWLFLKVFLSVAAIGKRIDKKNPPLGINDWQVSNLLKLKVSVVYYEWRFLLYCWSHYQVFWVPLKLENKLGPFK